MKLIEIKYHDENMVKIARMNQSDWIDLRSAEDVELNQGDFKLISLGISMKLPKGYEAHIAPRSSTYKNFGIIQANSVGVVDNSYSGDNDIWMFPAICLAEHSSIKKGDRICQFRIVKKQPKIEFYQVDSLGGANRGGFGSTGTK